MIGPEIVRRWLAQIDAAAGAQADDAAGVLVTDVTPLQLQPSDGLGEAPLPELLFGSSGDGNPNTRDALEAFMERGWPTPDVPDWVGGGYVTKERLMEALRLLAFEIDTLRYRYWAVSADGAIEEADTGKPQ